MQQFLLDITNGSQLHLHLYDKDNGPRDDDLGRATLEVANIVKKGQDDLWVTLEQAKHGMVHLRLTWLTLSKEYSDLKLALEETQLLRVTSMSTAILTIFLDSANKLPRARASRQPDPYAVLQVGKHKQQTKVQMRTNSPVWEEGFTFLVANPESDTLYLSIIDKKTESELCQLIFQINSLAQKENMEVIKQPFSLQKSGLVIWSMHLRILRQPAAEETHCECPVLEKQESEPLMRVPPSPLKKQCSSTSLPGGSTGKPEEAIELIEDSSVPLLANEPISDEQAHNLLHRSQSSTSSAGEAGLGRIQLTLRYSVQRQRLIIVVHKIAHIPLKDPSSVPDPYVKLYLLPERAKDTKRKTQVVKDNCNPSFDESFEYLISQGDLGAKQLEVTIGTEKKLFYTSSNVLGQVIIDLGRLNLAQPYTAWFDLQPEAE